MEYLGLLLPDLFALILLKLEFRLADAVRPAVSGHLGSMEPDARWALENAIARGISRQVFIGTFFVPGSVSLVTFLALVLEAGMAPWVVLSFIFLSAVWIGDILYCLIVSHDRLDRAESTHRWLVTIFIVAVMVAKVFAKMGYVAPID